MTKRVRILAIGVALAGGVAFAATLNMPTASFLFSAKKDAGTSVNVEVTGASTSEVVSIATHATTLDADTGIAGDDYYKSTTSFRGYGQEWIDLEKDDTDFFSEDEGCLDGARAAGYTDANGLRHYPYLLADLTGTAGDRQFRVGPTVVDHPAPPPPSYSAMTSMADNTTLVLPTGVIPEALWFLTGANYSTSQDGSYTITWTYPDGPDGDTDPDTVVVTVPIKSTSTSGSSRNGSGTNPSYTVTTLGSGFKHASCNFAGHLDMVTVPNPLGGSTPPQVLSVKIGRTNNLHGAVAVSFELPTTQFETLFDYDGVYKTTSMALGDNAIVYGVKWGETTKSGGSPDYPYGDVVITVECLKSSQWCATESVSSTVFSDDPTVVNPLVALSGCTNQPSGYVSCSGTEVRYTAELEDYSGNQSGRHQEPLLSSIELDYDIDHDGDGYGVGGHTWDGRFNATTLADCDDNNATIHPEATEVIETVAPFIDNNCSGEINEGSTMYDGDGDCRCSSGTLCVDSVKNSCGDVHGAASGTYAGSWSATPDGTAALNTSDCNDSASTCTTSCVDQDGDGVTDCLDRCQDQDHDDYGDTNSVSSCISTCAVGACSSGTACTLGDATCTGTDIDDLANSCTTSTTDSDGDGVRDCLDLCLDGDQDNYGKAPGISPYPAAVGTGAADVSACMTPVLTSGNVTSQQTCLAGSKYGDQACLGTSLGSGLGTDCKDDASSCTVASTCGDTDGDTVFDCLDACTDPDRDNYGTTVSITCKTNGVTNCTLGDTSCDGTDVFEGASSCTTDSTDNDADGVFDCRDMCVDPDEDNYGTAPGSTPIGTGAVAVSACKTNGTTNCSVGNSGYGDAACTGADQFENASSCTTDLSDSDGDGVADCRDLCIDRDRDHYGAIPGSTVVIGAGSIPVTSCTTNGQTACTVPNLGYGDGACTGATDCNDQASSCTTDCSASSDPGSKPACLDLCSDPDGDDHGVDRSGVFVGDNSVAIGSCTTNGTTACNFAAIGDSACLAADCDETSSVAAFRFNGNSESCDGIDNDCNNVVPTDELDADNDGAVTCNVTVWRAVGATKTGGDCQDTGTFAANRKPGASEVCDGLDNDCNTTVPSVELDADGDGYITCARGGEPWRGVTTGWPSGASEPSATLQDCDDTTPGVAAFRTPGAAEVCDGIDNDCNASLLSTEIDTDGDGFVACSIHPHGWKASPVKLGGDCDESVGSGASGQFRNPGLTETCDGLDNDCSDPSGGLPPSNEIDDDTDRYVECTISGAGWRNSATTPLGGADCDDTDSVLGRARFPTNPEVCDGVDNNCDSTVPVNERDQDGDGYIPCTPIHAHGYLATPVKLPNDCEDVTDNVAPLPAARNPAAPEIPNGVDDNCDGLTDIGTAATDNDHDGFCVGFDLDNNGSLDCSDGSTPGDCRDTGPAVNGVPINQIYPGRPELANNVDDDCDGVIDDGTPARDHDGDCYCVGAFISSQTLKECTSSLNPSCTTIKPGDCEDFNTVLGVSPNQVHPDRLEVWYDGVDEDCSGNVSDYDQDGDGENCDGSYTGSGAFPTNATICPGSFGTDCDDTLAGRFTPVQGPAKTGAAVGQRLSEVWYNGIDENCDGKNDFDQDGDGFVRSDFPAQVGGNAPGAGDCDDTPAGLNGIAGQQVKPTQPELYYDGIDQNCDLRNDYDQDNDGYVRAGDDAFAGGSAPGIGDCADTNLTLNPGKTEVCEPPPAQVDQDCDGNPNTSHGEYLFTGSAPLIKGPFYLDTDGDGEGAANSPQFWLCDRNADPLKDSFSLTKTDCNDNDPAISQGAEERCNGLDDDCNDIRDEPKVGFTPAGCATFILDDDNDGAGRQVPGPSDTICMCPDWYNEPANLDECEGTGLATQGHSVEFARACWSINGTDCDDNNKQIGPLAAGGGEIIDGRDNDCDGNIPLIEIDCDNDGAFALLPTPRTTAFHTADEVGLSDCDAIEPPPTVTCFGGVPIPLSCDRHYDSSGDPIAGGSGLWMVQTTVIEDLGLFENGRRIGRDANPLCSAFWDCDEQCPARCDGNIEICDGIDNDCANADKLYAGEEGIDKDGMPDVMDPGLPALGYVSPDELDLDGDTFMACSEGLEVGQPSEITDRGCRTRGTNFDDCNDTCGLVNPDRDLVCNGFINEDDCSGDEFDAIVTSQRGGVQDPGDEGDGMRTCGVFGNAEDGSVRDEQIYVLVYYDGDTVAQENSPSVSGLTYFIPSVPLVPPRCEADECDAQLREELRSDRMWRYPGTDPTIPCPDLHSVNGVPGPAGSGEEWAVRPYWEPMLRFCIRADACRRMDEGLDPADPDQALYAGYDHSQTTWPRADDCDELRDENGVINDYCGVAVLSLTPDADSALYDTNLPGCMEHELDADGNPTQNWVAFHPEQAASRTVWSRDRIVEARRIVSEWECYRLYGTYGCHNVGEPTGFQSPYDWRMRSTSDHVAEIAGDGGFFNNPITRRVLTQSDFSGKDGEVLWWKEITRYNPVPLEATVNIAGCWSERPDQGIVENNAFRFTGGDCDPTEATVNRDQPEGPGDLVAQYFNLPTDCRTCVDGLDNNCNGLTDCDDPGCAECFVGQGLGCSPGDDKCGPGGCSYGMSPRTNPQQSWGFLLLLSGLAIGLRRRVTM